MNEKLLDKLTRFIVVGLALGVAGFIFVVASVALFGPQLAPLMNKLPW